MDSSTFSGATLEKALKEGALTPSSASLTGMVKPSETSGYIRFSQSGCEGWVDLPTEMIERADFIGQRPCRDHSHPVMRILLKEPKNAEGRILAALLAQASTHPSSVMPSVAPLPESQFQAESRASQANIVFCQWRCVEWSKLFPNICNRWVLDCGWGPIIIIGLPGVVAR